MAYNLTMEIIVPLPETSAKPVTNEKTVPGFPRHGFEI